MRTQTLTPYNFTIKRYPFGEPVLFLCDCTEASFDVVLPDAQAVKDVQSFYFQKIIESNTVRIIAQFGQSINDVEKISLLWKHHTVMMVSDGYNFRMLSGIVPEIPATFPLGPYWRVSPDGYNLKWERETTRGSSSPSWQEYDKYYN